ncbi:10322_t:CDS:2 [Ambispora gerdemannii]|uniref:10322_t:CDS:1 n=1 Tax=Ambispora gerdemannii TaxID=144530 RepID=A0A9N9A4F3_9GLOM|nr:10322_t:CDS:2 [Ambispora gerdemannii]
MSYSKDDQTYTPLPSIQRVFLQSMAAEDPDGRFIIVDNIQVYYKVALPPEDPMELVDPLNPYPSNIQKKPVIVLLHHFMGNLYTWRNHMQPLADATGLPVVAYDRPAFGFTERLATWEENKNPYTQEACPDLLVELLRGIGYGDRRVVIIGVSGGGAVAAALAIKRPGYVQAIVMLAPAIKPQDQARHILASLPGRLFIKVALSQYIPFTSFYHNVESIPEWETVVRPCYRVPLTLPNFYESLGHVMRYFRPLEIMEHLHIIHRHTPVLYIAGDTDRYMPGNQHPQAFLDMTRNMPEGTMFEWHLLSECGHLPQDEKPREVLELTLDFLKRAGVYQPRCSE